MEDTLQYRQAELLSSKEVKELVLLAQSGDEKARNRIIEHNYRLVISIARKYTCPGLTIEDLIQEGILGLFSAIRKFEPDRGYAFSTYATPWIRQSIVRAIESTGRQIRLPMAIYHLARKISYENDRLAQRLGREPTVEELAEVLDIKPSLLRSIQNTESPHSLDRHLKEDGATFADYQVGDGPDPAAVSITAVHREIIHQYMAELKPLWREVIVLRYGMNGHPVHTLKQAAERLCLSRERIRQIEKLAIRQMKKSGITRFF